MAKKYTSEQFWKLYEKLPKELKDALFAEETGNNIYDTCERNGILKNLGEVVEYVGQVLVGVLPPDDFQETLEKEIKLKNDVAKKVAREINRFIFYPVKINLEELYGTEIAPPAQPKISSLRETPPRETPKEKPEIPLEKDTYREQIE